MLGKSFTALVTNYQRRYWNDDILGLKKTPLVIVDFFSNSITEENFRKRRASHSHWISGRIYAR